MSEEKHDINELHNTIYDAYEDLARVSRSLDELAYCFEITGNEKVEKKIRNISKTIKSNIDNIRSAYGRELSYKVKQSQQSSINIVNAAIAGILIGQGTYGE